MAWRSSQNGAGEDCHIIPLDDLMEHCESRECNCRPFVDESQTPVAVVHHAADFREYSEPDHVPGMYEQRGN
jgi:hypothetical protein